MIGDNGAFYFDNISAEDVNLFLLKQKYKSPIFISEMMDIFVWPSKPSSQLIWLKV